MCNASCTLIRPARAEDMAALARLIEDHAAYEGLPLAAGFQRQEALAALAFGEEAKINLWVVTHHQRPVGYMSATVDHSTWSAAPFVYLDCLYLAEAVRGQGLGRRLMAVLEAFALSRGCARIEWQTPPDNALGLAFYRRIGATELPKARFSLGVGVPQVRARCTDPCEVPA